MRPDPAPGRPRSGPGRSPSALLVLLFLLPAAPGHAQPAPDTMAVVAGVLEDWPPAYSRDDRGEPAGYAVDVLREVADRAALRISYRSFPTFSDALAALAEGGVDLLPNMGILPVRERDLDVAFTRPYETHAIRVFVRRSTPGIESLDDLRGRPVGVVESNVGVSIAGARPGLRAVLLPDVRSALFQLLAGEIDALIYPEPVILHLARRAGIEDELRSLDEELLEVRRGMAVGSERARELIGRLDAALSEVLSTGAFERIYSRWHAPPAPFWTGRRIATAGAASLLLVILGMGLWRHLSVLRLERQLREEATRFRSLAEGLAEGLMVAEAPEGRVVYVNQRCAEILGYERDELEGMRVADLVSEPDSDRIVSARLRARERGESERYETRLTRKDGSPVWVEVHAAPYRLEGEVVGSLAALVDISARKEAEEELERRNRQLRQVQKMESVGRLAAGIAHDFNNLLTVVRAHSDFLLLELQSDGPLSEEVRAIQDATDRASELTSQLLAFGREQVLRLEEVDLSELVRSVERLLGRVIPESIRIVTELDRRPLPVRLDPGQMEQVILNLVLNARDAMPSGGTLTLSTGKEIVDAERARRHAGLIEGRYARLDVSDTGVGMDPETVSRIFEPFFTAKGKSKGSGLGLAMVYGIVKQSDGTVYAESTPGEGTTFTLRFPLLEAAGDDGG